MSWPGLTRPSRSGTQCPPKRDPKASEATPFFERLPIKPGDDEKDGIAMRAEIERLVEEIKQSVGLLRRHL
jgi:hypothetical protein